MNIFNKMLILAFLTMGLAHGMEKMPENVSAESEIKTKEAASLTGQNRVKSIVITNQFPNGCAYGRNVRQLRATSESGEQLGFIVIQNNADSAGVENIEVTKAYLRNKIGKRLMCAIPYFFPNTPKVTLGSMTKSSDLFYISIGLQCVNRAQSHFSWSPEAWKAQMESLQFEKRDDLSVRVSIRD